MSKPLCMSLNVEMTSNQITVDLNKDNKFNGKNYDIWQRRVTLLLTGEDLVHHLTQLMIQPIMPDDGSIDQYHLDLEIYNKWVKKDRCARIILLSSMNDDLLAKYHNYFITKQL